MGEGATVFAPLGTLFIQLIKMLVVPLVAVSIISGAATLGGSRSAGKIGVVSIGYIMVTTVISIIIAIVFGLVFKPGAGLSAESVGTGTYNLKGSHKNNAIHGPINLTSQINANATNGDSSTYTYSLKGNFNEGYPEGNFVVSYYGY